MTPVLTWRPLRTCGQKLRWTARWLGTVGLTWLCLASTTWAQQYVEEKEEKNYVVSYMLIMFAVSFGLMMICRGGKRTTSFRQEA